MAMANGVSCCSSLCLNDRILTVDIHVPPLGRNRGGSSGFIRASVIHPKKSKNLPFSQRERCSRLERAKLTIPFSGTSPDSSGSEEATSEKTKAPFGYSRKDVLLIGLGVTILGYGMKSALEFAGFDSLQAGNAVQLIVVLGLTVGWISTYMFRVSNKEMTYAQQLRDYESKVMEKRLESLSEAELAALLEQVEEEKRNKASSERVE